MMHQRAQPRTVLRGGSLVSAPFTLGALVCAAICGLSISWVFSTDDIGDAPGWLTAAAFGAFAVILLTAARGCRVVLDADRISDQVAWRTVWGAATTEITAVRVRRGPWRTFETEDADGHRRVVLGAGPVQFPANLSSDAAAADLAAIDMLSGSVRS